MGMAQLPAALLASAGAFAGVGSLYDCRMENIGGTRASLADLQGKLLLVVNTASFCGYACQFEGLQAPY